MESARGAGYALLVAIPVWMSAGNSFTMAPANRMGVAGVLVSAVKRGTKPHKWRKIAAAVAMISITTNACGRPDAASRQHNCESDRLERLV